MRSVLPPVLLLLGLGLPSALLPLTAHAAGESAPTTSTPPKPTKLSEALDLFVSPGANSQVAHTIQLPLGKSGAKIPVQTVNVTSGRVEAKFHSAPKQRGVLLQAPGGLAALSTSGALTMIVQGDQVAIVSSDPDTLVGLKGKFRALSPDLVRRVNLRTGEIQDAPRLASPSIQSAKSLHVLLEGGTTIPLSVSPISGAASYVLELRSTEKNAPALQSSFRDPSAIAAALPHAGSYTATVYAVDELGIAGASSAPLTLRVLGLAPDQNLVNHGVIHLDADERAQLLGVEGLLMRYGTSPEFVPATSSLGLPSQRATFVEFRDPRDPRASALLSLAPRVLDAHISLGPSYVKWPGESVQIQIQIRDGEGRPAPLSQVENFTVVVSVNSREVPLDFQRAPGELKAELPPQSSEGPWVVRVSLKNPKGVELTRNFIEVARGTTVISKRP